MVPNNQLIMITPSQGWVYPIPQLEIWVVIINYLINRVNRVADVPQGLAPLPTNVSKTGPILWILSWLVGSFPFYIFSAYILHSVIEKV